jgi:phage gp37-like protein
MSATILLDQAVARVRASFTRSELVTCQPYAGEFSTAEIPHKSFACPAIFITVLGWQPASGNGRMVGRNTNTVRLAAFVVFKHAERNKRMAGAMLLAERLAINLRQWAPMTEAANAALPVTIGGLETDAGCENLYSRALDDDGLALFLVDWHQDVKPNVPLEQLWDLLSVDIIDNTRRGSVPADAAATGITPAVTEQVNFI